MENKISFKTELLLYILLSFIMTIDTLCFYSQDEEDIYVLLLLVISLSLLLCVILFQFQKRKEYSFGGN